MGLTVYRTVDPGILATWHATREAMTAWPPKVEALMEDLGVGGRKILFDSVSGRVWGVDDDGSAIPEHWRLDNRRACLMPRRSTRDGKKIAARIDAMRRPDPRDLKGMPSTTFADDEPTLCTCGVEEIDGTLYVTWSAAIPEREVDLTLWERLKLSEYYAIQEAQGAE